MRDPIWISGDQLSASTKQEVLATFVHRWTSNNLQRGQIYGFCPHCQTYGGKPSEDNVACRQKHPTLPLITDTAWIAKHKFAVNADGTLSQAVNFCELV